MLIYLDIKIPHLQIAHLGAILRWGILRFTIQTRYVHDDNPANANLPRQAPCHCGAPQVNIIKIKLITIIITIMINHR